jgi:hypothetical protein
MPVEKATTAEDLPMGQMLDIEIDAEEEMPDVEIEFDPEGGVVVNIGEDEDEDVPYDANLAEVLPEDVLSEIGSTLSVLFDADKSSRATWEDQYSKGMELLGFSMEERTKPFKGACGVYHPLLSESVVQFQSQALKELMPSGGPVRTQVLGKETREKLMQADRVRDFMNYQITCEMPEYTPDFDQLLFYVGYGGSAFKKICYDESLGRMVSTLVLPDDLYIPYHGSSVMSKCERITHRVFMSENAYRKAVVAGKYLDVAELMDEASSSQIQENVDKITGMSPSGDQSEIVLLEFQIDYDLPGFEDMGEDDEPTGIKLPYIITMDEASGKIIGVRRNWKEGDETTSRKEYYIHYLLVQGPGSYGLGFLHLIGGCQRLLLLRCVS